MSTSVQLLLEKKEKEASNVVIREEAIKKNKRNMTIQNDVENDIRNIEMEEERIQWCIPRSDHEKLNIMRSAGYDWDVEDFDYFMSK